MRQHTCRARPAVYLLLVGLVSGCDEGPETVSAAPVDSGTPMTDTSGPGGSAGPGATDQSADGYYFASNRSGNYELYTQVGDTLTALTDDAAFDSWWPRQSPDGQHMLFYRSRVGDRPPTGGYNNNYEDASLYSLDLNTGVERVLIGTGGNGWSAQGVVDWSPDGSRIAFETAVDPAYVGVGKWAIRTIDPSGNQLRSVLDDGNVNTLPRWNVDGSRLLFHRFVFGSGHGFIVASMAADGSDYRPITTGGAFDDTDLDWLR